MTAIHLLAGEIGHAGIGERRVGGGTHDRACGVLAKEGRNLRDVGVRNLLKPAPLIVCLALATALLMATADVAIASLFLVFDRISGAPGTVVHVHTGGNGACVVCPHRLPLYFAEAVISDGIRSPDDPRLARVGRLTVDEHGNGSGLLTVPEVPNGRYVVMAYCKPCAPNSAGRVILPLGPFPTPFRVFGSPADRSAPIWPWIIGGLVGGVLAAAALAWWFRGRRARLHDPEIEEELAGGARRHLGPPVRRGHREVRAVRGEQPLVGEGLSPGGLHRVRGGLRREVPAHDLAGASVEHGDQVVNLPLSRSTALRTLARGGFADRIRELQTLVSNRTR